jgi:tyrosine-protein kinase Etk/Wzc
MTQSQTNAQGTSKRGDEISLLEILIIMARYKKRIAAISVAGTLLAVAISFALPSIFVASTKLLPPQQSQSSANALLSQLGGIAGMAAGASGLKNPNDLYVGMLKSRTVADHLVARFNLKQVYGTKSLENARLVLQKSTTITSGKEGLISIVVEGTDKALVAPLANGYVSELTQLTKVLAVTEAAERRMFYERQLVQAKDNLTSQETALKNSLDRSGVISVDTESRAMLETVGHLRAQVSAKEIQLSSMRAFLTPNNNEYKRAEEELASLKIELSKLENGRGDERSGSASVAGRGGFENIKLLRDVKYYQMLYELLSKQYEAARLDEAKDPSVIQVLDPAVEPEHKFKPRRSVIVAVGAVLAFLFAVLSCFVSEAGRKLLDSDTGMAQWRELKSLLKKK